MDKVRNRSLFILLLVAACLAPPALARQQSSWWLAQVRPDSPDATPAETDAEGEAVAPEADSSPEAEEPPMESVDDSDAVDNPDAGDATDGMDSSAPAPAQPTPTPAGEAPPDLTPTFMLPDSLPEGSTLTIEGSASMGTITRSLVQSFQTAYPGANVTLIERTSDNALADLQAGKTDLAAIGRPLTEEEEAEGLMEVSVSREKIAMIVSDANPFTGDLNSEDFVRIFRGEITNWQELGGPDLPIRLIDRPITSDTRRALADYETFGGDLTTGANGVQVANDSTAEVVDALGDNGIGYAIASQVLNQDNVRVLPMHGTLPDDPRYPYSQPRNYVYRGDETLPPAVEAFLAFATNTTAGQEAVAQAKAAEAADVAVADLPDRVIAMRPNGQGFVTGDRQGNLKFWNTDGTSAGEPVLAHTGPVTALAFSPDGQRLISGGADGTIRFWDAIGTPIGEPINAGNQPVTSLVAQPDGSFISASADGTLQKWDNTGNPDGEPIRGHEDTVRDMVLSPDGQTLITAAKDGTIRQWNVPDGTPKGEPITDHQGAVQTLAVKPDGGFFSGGADGTVRQWDANGVAVGTPSQMPGPVTTLATNADGTSLAGGDDTGSLRLFDGNGTPMGDPIDVGASVDDVTFTPTGDRIVVSAGEMPQIRDQSGTLIPTPSQEGTVDSEGTAPDWELPPQLLEFWQRFQQLPLSMRLLLLPIVVLLLLLWLLLRSWQKDEGEEAEEPEVAGALPEASQPITPGPEPGTVVGLTPEVASGSLDTNLTRARQALSEGNTLFQAGRYQTALERFNQAIEAADVERLKAAAVGTSLVGAGALIAQGMARRGECLTHLGRSDEALKSLDRALEMAPNDVTPWIGKGNLMAQMGRLDEAIFCFDKAIELNPNMAAAWQGKGKALQKMGREAEARRCFAKAQELSSPEGTVPMPGNIPPGQYDGATIGVSPVPDQPDPGRSPGISVGPVDQLEPGYGPTPDLDEDIPPEVRDAIANLPSEPDLPSPQAEFAPPIPVPPDVEAIEAAGDPTVSEIPPEVQQAIEYLPTEAEVPDPSAPVTAPIAVPPEVNDILSGTSDLPGAETVGEIPDFSEFPVTSPPGRTTPAPQRPSAARATAPTPIPSITPDVPEDPKFDPALADLPPEVLEALKGIPEDSPDSFNLPPEVSDRKTPPPPPPSNPRLRKPSA